MKWHITIRLPQIPQTGEFEGGWNGAVIALLLASLACGVVNSKPPGTTPNTLPATSTIALKATELPTAFPSHISTSVTLTPDTSIADTLIEHRWAVRSFADPETAADPDMADGKPDVTNCTDPFLPTWAPPASPDQAILTLNYAAPLVPSQVNVFHIGDPSGIVHIEVLNSLSGLGRLIYDSQDSALRGQSKGKCPATLTLPVKVDFSVDTVIITFAASETPIQIDAVELVGTLPDFVDLPVFWRVSIPSEDPPEDIGLPGGLAADSLGQIHLAEGAHGVHTYDVEGNPIQIIPAPSNSNLVDVAADPFGNLIVTDKGSGKFIVLSSDGAQIVTGGEDFKNGGPFAVAVSPLDGNLYLLDKNRIRVYTSDTADHLRDLPLQEGRTYLGLAFDAAGNLYTASVYDESVLKIDPASGEILDTLGVPALVKTTSRDLALDADGNIYVLVNSSPGDVAVYMLDSHGNLLNRFGRLVYPPPEGERSEATLFDPISLDVTPDGRFLVICNAYNDTTFLTAFKLKD